MILLGINPLKGFAEGAPAPGRQGATDRLQNAESLMPAAPPEEKGVPEPACMQMNACAHTPSPHYTHPHKHTRHTHPHTHFQAVTCEGSLTPKAP